MEILFEFVKQTCYGRDESHGYEHMKKVMDNAIEIFSAEYDIKQNEEMLNDIILVAMLHDVADHKYDKDNSLNKQVYDFLENNSDKPKLLMDIIERIAYSKEEKNKKSNTPQDWNDILGEYGCQIRNIVSDADKLQALGKIGFERCVEYSRYNYREKNNKEITPELLKQNVIAHANDKLLRLKDEFIYTKTGKEMAIPLHDEFVKLLNEM